MPRPPRLEYANALYHVTSRGARKGAIFLDGDDRAAFLAILARMLRRCDAHVFAYCLMGNHYHLVLQTRQANVSSLMHHVNSVYGFTFNRRHSLCGALFEPRFKAVHVDRDSYLLEVCRYVDLNPVRAGLVASPARWAWSSYRANAGLVPSPSWLASAEVHGALTGRSSKDGAEIAAARNRYSEWVDAGRDVRLWRASLRRGRFLGDDAFVERVMRSAG